jgi:hypothetical protein
LTTEELDRLERLVGSKNYDDVEELWCAIPKLIWMARDKEKWRDEYSKTVDRFLALQAMLLPAHDALMQKSQVLADECTELRGHLSAAEMTVETQKRIANQALFERDAALGELTEKTTAIRNLHLLNDTEVEVKCEMRAEKDKRIRELEAALKQTANRYSEGYIVVKLIVNQALEGSDHDGSNKQTGF